jgi:hypothetical protein
VQAAVTTTVPSIIPLGTVIMNHSPAMPAPADPNRLILRLAVLSEPTRATPVRVTRCARASGDGQE